MITRLPLLAAAVAFCSTSLTAAPLSQATTVYAQPDAASPALAVLAAGAEPTPASGGAPAPSGWLAVELPGPHEVYVQDRDLMKDLQVRPGAAYRIAPQAEAVVLAQAAAGDKTEITGLRGRWTQLQLEKPIRGYLRVAAPAPAPTPTPSVPAPAPAAPLEPRPAVTTAGRPVPMAQLGDGGSGALPRFFQGQMAPTRRPLRPRRPYDYQLNDDAGVRYAYLDLSKLLLTEQIDKYAHRQVVVYGTVRKMTGSEEIVIEVESLQLR